MTRLEDLPPNTEAEWTCGHVAGAVCAECHRSLCVTMNYLAAECDRLTDENLRLRHELARLRCGSSGTF